MDTSARFFAAVLRAVNLVVAGIQGADAQTVLAVVFGGACKSVITLFAVLVVGDQALVRLEVADVNGAFAPVIALVVLPEAAGNIVMHARQWLIHASVLDVTDVRGARIRVVADIVIGQVDCASYRIA